MKRRVGAARGRFALAGTDLFSVRCTSHTIIGSPGAWKCQIRRIPRRRNPQFLPIPFRRLLRDRAIRPFQGRPIPSCHRRRSHQISSHRWIRRRVLSARQTFRACPTHGKAHDRLPLAPQARRGGRKTRVPPEAGKTWDLRPPGLSRSARQVGVIMVKTLLSQRVRRWSPPPRTPAA